MGLGQCTSKSILIILGTIFFLSAGLCWGVGAYVIATYNDYVNFLESKLLLVPAVAVIGVGIIFFLAGLLGCCGSENRCTLTLFGIFLTMLLGGLVAGIVLSQTNKAQIQSIVEKKAEEYLHKYDTNGTKLDKQIDWYQTHWDCCGMHNATDYQRVAVWNAAYPDMVPASCSKSGNATEPIPLENNGTYYVVGCVDKVENIIDGNIQYILGSMLGFAILIVLGIVCSCVLCCLRRQEQVPYFSLN